MSDRDDRIDRLYALALDQPAELREAFIGAAAEDDDIKNEVRAVLAADEYAGDFLSGSASDVVEEPILAPGTTLGQYRIERLLGRGGMGVVYEARDTRLDRRVALKSLAPDFERDERQRERLEREARAAAALAHPGIAIVYALEEFDHHLYIASEYLDGDTLRVEMSQGPLAPARVVDVGIQLAQALDAAHERHVVHRDLKPENVIRLSSGALKILDFGLAQIVDPTELMSRTRTAARQRLTREGLIAGTPPYMSPEQLRGRVTDFRTDHFSLGVLLYEAATGRHPFGGSSLDSVIAPDPDRSAGSAGHAGRDARRHSGRSSSAASERIRHSASPRRRELAAALEAARDEIARASSRPLAAATTSPPIAALAASADALRTAEGSDQAPLKWWRFHQMAAALAYWTMVWPAWIVHGALGRGGLAFFFALLAAIVIAGNLRLHLWFSSRVYPEDLASRLADVSRWIRGADIAFAALLIVGGIALPETRAGWAAVLISFGIGAALAAFIIEPATERAALRKLGQAGASRASPADV